MPFPKTFQYSKSFLLVLIRRQTARWLSSGVVDVSEEVRHALMSKKPVVALESTIITHGMSYPYNLETAVAVENIIRHEGATPATIGVLDGRIKIGLSSEKLDVLSKKQHECFKISRRDIPFIISQGLTGGTTVSATMLIAHKAGIPIFVTGGIGGVHRNGESTMDISADLTELSRTPVAVISSGVKSILDIARTLEYLETQGVAVATFGSTNDFPAFYTRMSGHKVPYSLKTPKEAAAFIRAIFDVTLNSGALIAVPIPEEYSFDEEKIERAIAEGIEESKRRNILGKDITPFLLEYISRITKGESLKSNIALIKNNALFGARISVELSKMVVSLGSCGKFSDSGVREFRSVTSSEVVYRKDAEPRKAEEVVVVGGSNLDYVINIAEPTIKPKAVFFSCIDSRMVPTRFTETDIGDMFVVRNAGNLIPHSRNYPDEITTNEPAALELGCVINNVKHIIVCGHSDCKAMNLLYNLRDEKYSSQTNRRISPLRAWMCAHASSSLKKFNVLTEEGFDRPLLFEAETPQRQFVAYIDPDNKFALEDKLSQVNTLQQMQNIASYGFLRRRLRDNDLHIHAIWFDIYTGEIYYFSRCAKQFVEVKDETIFDLLNEVNTYYS